jgi:hydrogenase maturation protease
VTKKKPQTLILGLGNPILCDDGVGPAIARKLQSTIDTKEATVIEASLGGLNLLDLLVGYERVIIIDAIKTEGGRAGQIHRFSPSSLTTTRYTASVHDVDLVTALELGKRLKLAMPSRIDIFAIEVADTERFSEECTPAVAAAIPVCVEIILRELGK